MRAYQSQDRGGVADQSAFRNHIKGAGPCHRGLLRVFIYSILFCFNFLILFYFILLNSKLIFCNLFVSFRSE